MKAPSHSSLPGSTRHRYFVRWGKAYRPRRGGTLASPIRTNLSKDEFVQRSTKTAAAGVGSHSCGEPISPQGHLYAVRCCVRSVCVDPVACTGRSCTAAAATLPLLLVSGQAVESSRLLRAWLPSEVCCLCTAPACLPAPAYLLRSP